MAWRQCRLWHPQGYSCAFRETVAECSAAAEGQLASQLGSVPSTCSLQLLSQGKSGGQDTKGTGIEGLVAHVADGDAVGAAFHWHQSLFVAVS